MQGGINGFRSLEIKMEIKVEFEDSDIECNFTPDFRLQQNTADHSSVSWRLSSSRDACDVVFLCDEFQDEKPTHSPIFSSTGLRLLLGRDESDTSS